MTVNIPIGVIEIQLEMIELKLDRLIDEMRFLKSHTIAFDTRMRGIEAYLKPSEPREQQPESKFTPWLAAVAGATARTALFGVGAAVGAAVTKLYLGT
jgi:anti-sigma factor RsiW